MDVVETRNAILEEILRPMYREASDELRSLVEFPSYDVATDTPIDIPDLADMWRTSVVADNPIFPPLWRVQAYRTILPSELAGQIGRWKTWSTEVSNAMHDQYLQWLHLHHDSDWLRYHWSYLRSNAVLSLSKQAKWANTPEINAVRDRILRLAEPRVFAAPIRPSACKEDVDKEQYSATRAMAQRVNELTGAWNYHAKSNFRLPDYRSCYHATLDDFRRHASNDWLIQFLVWAERCADREFGLYLDY